MRVLTCVICSTRSWQVTWDNFKRHLIGVTGSDLCLSVGSQNDSLRNDPFVNNAKYRFIYPEPADYGFALDAACAMEGVKPNWRQLLRIKDIWMGGVNDEKYGQFSGSAIPLFYRWWLVKNLQLHNILDNYDWFIMTRSDNFFEFDHIKLDDLDPEHIYMPESQDYGGLQDRHIVASRKHVVEAFDLATHLIHRPDDVFDGLHPLQPVNIEKYQKFIFERMGLAGKIIRFPRMMYLVKGAEDKSRWSHGAFEPRCNKTIKYQSEFEIVWANKNRQMDSVPSPVPVMRSF